MILAVGCHPARAAGPALGIAIPAGAPTLNEIEAAAGATVPSAGSPGAGLAPLLDANGNAVMLQSNNGAFGGAYTDAAGNTIISFQATARQSQYQAAVATLAGTDPNAVAAYGDAVTFAEQVVSLAVSQGRQAARIYVTGFSEGGMLASFVGLRTGLPGVSFASCGLPGYAAAAAPASNFLAFVESGDPIGQYGTDTAEVASADVSSAHMDHYGYVLTLGAPVAGMQSFAAGLAGHTLAQLVTGAGLTPQQENVLVAAEGSLQSTYHSSALYNADANALAAAYGYH